MEYLASLDSLNIVLNKINTREIRNNVSKPQLDDND